MSEDTDWEEWSEDDVRIRPNPRGSRPRTKVRPKYEDATPGFVTGVDETDPLVSGDVVAGNAGLHARLREVVVEGVGAVSAARESRPAQG